MAETETIEGLLRPLHDDDSPAMIRLMTECFAEYEGCVFAIEEWPELLAPARHFLSRSGAGWAVERDGQLVATVGIHPNGAAETWELTKLYVDPGARRLGLGRRLVEHALEQAAARGASRLELWTDTRFTKAHRLYESMGFLSDGTARDIDDLSASVEYYYVRPLK